MRFWPFYKKTTKFFSKTDEKIIVAAIKAAEKKTSGEIRIHVESNCYKNPYDRALEVFQTLKMHQTKEQNGILFYLAMESNLFSLIGDKGIHEKVGSDFWEAIKEETMHDFKNNNIALEKAILKCGDALHQYFPYHAAGDKNELDDDISYGQ
jgi:uncharacterized membrane protein